jgi:hypothetical protein
VPTKDFEPYIAAFRKFFLKRHFVEQRIDAGLFDFTPPAGSVYDSEYDIAAITVMDMNGENFVWVVRHKDGEISEGQTFAELVTFLTEIGNAEYEPQSKTSGKPVTAADEFQFPIYKARAYLDKKGFEYLGNSGMWSYRDVLGIQLRPRFDIPTNSLEWTIYIVDKDNPRGLREISGQGGYSEFLTAIAPELHNIGKISAATDDLQRIKDYMQKRGFKMPSNRRDAWYHYVGDHVDMVVYLDTIILPEQPLQVTWKILSEDRDLEYPIKEILGGGGYSDFLVAITPDLHRLKTKTAAIEGTNHDN